MSTLPINDILAQSETSAREHLSKLAAQMGLARGRVRVSAQIGMPVDRIMAMIDEERIDLVVLGRHGRGIVGHLLLGSVAEKVVRQSPVPVLTVHGTAERSHKVRRAKTRARRAR
jgi:nucleotide-binding universal stress UspA family protein